MLWNNFDIYIRNKEISQSTLEEIMEKAYYIYKHRQLNSSASMIQFSWRRYQLNKAKNIINKQKNASAKVIQRAWRKYYKNIIQPRKKSEKENKAAIIIQRYYRGYRLKMKYSVIKGRIALEENMKYFDSVRNEMLQESAIIIARYWKKYKVRYI